MRKFKLAVCQNKPVRDKGKSIKRALEMIREAVDNGAELVVLPELFYHPYELGAISSLEEDNRRTLDLLRKNTSELGVHLCSGSTVELEGEDRFNKSFLLAPNGEIVLEYSKSHLFDVNFKDLRIKESLVFKPGNDVGVAETELGNIGILICYDIRFPEMARRLTLMGAEIILVPAAFNRVSGPAHWHLFFRTRAVENQVYVAAASPARDSDAKYQAYGHSLIADPWGDILCEAETDEKIIYADIDPERISDVRGRLPLLKHRRDELYTGLSET